MRATTWQDFGEPFVGLRARSQALFKSAFHPNSSGTTCGVKADFARAREIALLVPN